MKVILEIIKGPETGRKFEFTEPDTFLVGRAKEATFRLPEDDPYVSRRHFHLEINQPNAIFRDLNSKNTPRINNRETTERNLASGDVIEVGYTLLKVTIFDPVQTKSIKCQKCGKAFEIINNERVPENCDSCQRINEQEQRNRVVTKNITVTCACGKDLTKLANSDKRALELDEKVDYSCPKCLPKGDDEKGKKVDNYEIIKKIGEGGMGKVYLVYHPSTARILVCKKIIGLNNIQVLKRFDREVRFQSFLTHPNIIQFIDTGIFKQEPYLILEYAKLGDIGKLITDKGAPLAMRIAVNLIIGCLHGLEHIHTRKIIHRDIKPENILLKINQSGDMIPKISDLGIAKSINNAGGSTLTKQGVALGSTFYMAPEQIRDAKNVDERADLYSFGVMLYYLLTGKYPYDFPTQLDVIKWMAENEGKFRNKDVAFEAMKKERNPLLIILSENTIDIRERNPAIPITLARIVDKAIKKERTQRYKTATEFRKNLELLDL